MKSSSEETLFSRGQSLRSRERDTVSNISGISDISGARDVSKLVTNGRRFRFQS
jgi:hypothetical protein